MSDRFELSQRSKYLVEKHGIQPWFVKIPQRRNYHVAVVKYLRKNVHRDALVLETGCGMGQTMVVLHRYGFRRFIGVEKDKATLDAARELTSSYGIDVRLIHASGESYAGWEIAGEVDVYLPLNWTYFTPRIDGVLEAGLRVLEPGGLLIIDVIRNDYIAPNDREMRIYRDSYPYKRDPKEVLSLARSLGYRLEAADHGFGWRSLLFFRAP